MRKSPVVNTIYDVKWEPLIWVMIENSHASRIGMRWLSKAKIVYETLAEWWVTRFLALFEIPNESFVVWPIRSARDYFLDWAEEYKSAFVHCWGSDSALERLKTETQVLNIDESANTSLFMRDNSYHRPHNLFWDLEVISHSIKDDGYINPKSVVFTSAEIKYPDTNTWVSIMYFNWDYNTIYKYDPSIKKYLRFHSSDEHIDNMTNQQIAVDNIIIQEAPFVVTTEKLRLDMQNRSSWKCQIMTRWTNSACEWAYSNWMTSYTIWWKAIEFNDWNLWIEVVKDKSVYTIYNTSTITLIN